MTTHSACYEFPLDEKPAITYGQMGFKLVANAWVPWKALDEDHEAPMPQLNGMCSPEARKNYNRIGGEIVEMGEDFAWHTLEIALYFLPGPEDLAFAAFWKYAGERGFTCLVVNGRKLLFKAGKLLTGKEFEEAVGTLKDWSTKLGHSGNRVAPDVAEAFADTSETALRKAGKSVAPIRAAGFFDDLATAATRNADSTKLVLGKWSTTGQSYQNVAAHYKATYFKLDNWRELEKTLSREELWKVNEAFLRQQIKQGKQIILSHDPFNATGFFKNEVDFLSNFFRFEKDGWVWKAVPK